ncbi:MAG: sialate O-acetylesterase [bacterium]|nr:sialate O-acetylesterase [bacterium]
MSRSLAHFFATALIATTAACVTPSTMRAQRQPVQVFILAGQSNMEGKAQNKLLEHQAKADATKKIFARFRDEDQWIERNDVFIRFLDRHGPLSMGYGSKNRTGCELAFGHRLGDALPAPVLLIKTAWGGRSLRKDFRPPSAGLPDTNSLAAELAQRTKRAEKRGKQPPSLDELRAEYGKDYRNMLELVRDTLARRDELFPQLRGRKCEIRGLVWFQGWNDQYGGAEQEYHTNLEHFIRDIRRDLELPDLPFVIGAMGQHGSKPAKGAMKVIQEAQLAVAAAGKLKNVRTVATAPLVDRAAEALYPEWKKRRDEWDRTGSDHPYHYLGSAIWFTRIGDAFAREMLAMIE